MQSVISTSNYMFSSGGGGGRGQFWINSLITFQNKPVKFAQPNRMFLKTNEDYLSQLP